MRIDLDAARAARREARGEAPTVVLAGEEFTFEPEIPWQVAELFADGQVNEAVKLLLGESHERFMRAKPSVEDMRILLEELTKANGLDGLGESPASAASS